MEFHGESPYWGSPERTALKFLSIWKFQTEPFKVACLTFRLFTRLHFRIVRGIRNRILAFAWIAELAKFNWISNHTTKIHRLKEFRWRVFSFSYCFSNRSLSLRGSWPVKWTTKSNQISQIDVNSSTWILVKTLRILQRKTLRLGIKLMRRIAGLFRSKRKWVKV